MNATKPALFVCNFKAAQSTAKTVCPLSRNDFARPAYTFKDYSDEQAKEFCFDDIIGGLMTTTELATYATAMKATVEVDGQKVVWAMFEADCLKEAEIIARCVAIQFQVDAVAVARYDDDGRVSCGQLVGPNVSAAGAKFDGKKFVAMI